MEAMYLLALPFDEQSREVSKSLTWDCALANELNHGDTLSSSGSTENLSRKHLGGGFGVKFRSMKLTEVSRTLLANFGVVWAR